MAKADSLATSGWLNDVEQAIWPSLKPKIANYLYSMIESDPSAVVWTQKGSVWKIPYSFTIRAYMLREAINFLLGPDTRAAQPAIVK